MILDVSEIGLYPKNGNIPLPRNIANHCRIRHRQGVADNLPRGRPVEDFDLTRRVLPEMVNFRGNIWKINDDSYGEFM